jgi:hypothetical protein
MEFWRLRCRYKFLECNAYSWEPKKQHQFIMEIEGIPAYLIKTSAKPTIENGEITLDHINVKRYVKGKSNGMQLM